MIKIDILYFGYGCYRINPYLRIAKIYKKKIVCHWIGTDVLRAQVASDFKYVQSFINYNLACSPIIKEELSQLGIEAEEIPIVPAEMSENYSELPKKHSAVVYLPKGKEEFYGIEYLKYAAKKFKDIQFYIVGNDNDSINLKNVYFLGKISKSEMDNLYDKTTMLIRLPQHDGLSLMLMEALIKGKEVIYCYDYPFTRYVTTNEQLYKEIKDIISKPPEFNKKGHEYIIENYKINKIKQKLNNILINLLKE